MSSDNSSSVSTTDRTSASAPPQTQATAGTEGLKDRSKDSSETDFLQQQADMAKAAMTNTMRRMGRDMMNGVDPRAWMQDYPWWTLLGAVAAGVAVGAAVTPPKVDERTRRERERQSRRQEARMRSLMATLARYATAQAQGEDVKDVKLDGHDGHDGHGKSRGGGILSGLLKTGLDIIKPIIISSISAATAAQAGPSAVAAQQAATEQVDPDAAA